MDRYQTDNGSPPTFRDFPLGSCHAEHRDRHPAHHPHPRPGHLRGLRWTDAQTHLGMRPPNPQPRVARSPGIRGGSG